MFQPSIADISQLLKDNPVIGSAIKTMLEICLAQKNFTLPEEMDTEILLEYSAAERADDYIAVKLESFLVCHVCLNIAQEKLDRILPDDPLSAIKFVGEFCRLIREPKPNIYWYMALEEELNRYVMVFLNHEKGVDIASLVINIGPSEDFNDGKLVKAGQRALPYMNDSVQQTYKLLFTLLKDSPLLRSFDEPVFSLVNQNPQKAEQLFQYINEQGVDVLSTAYENLIIGLYKTNEDFYFGKAIHYFKSHKDKGIVFFSKLNFGSADKLEMVYELIKEHPDLYQRSLVFAAIVANIRCTKELIEKIFNDFQTFITTGDEAFQFDLALIISYLPGFDKEKMKLFPVFDKLGTRTFYMEWFQRFDFPDSLFDLIRSIYEQDGENADIQRCEFWLYSIQENHPIAFNAFLEELRKGDTIYGKSAAQTITSMLE